MNHIKILPFNLFKQRVEKLNVIPNHITAAHINKLFNYEYSNFTIDDLYPLHPRDSTFPEPSFGKSLYRVTECYKGFDEKNISFFQHPPSFISNLGRCNLPKFPVFYCSEVPEISLVEAVAKKLPFTDACYYISEWKVENEKPWKTLVFLLGNLPDINPLKKTMDNVRPNILDLFRKLIDNEKEIENYINYFNDEFTRDSTHIFSSLISHSFLYADDDSKKRGDMILYPSVQTDKVGNNYAFNTKFIDNGCIRLQKVYKIQIEYMNRRSNNNYTYFGNLHSIGEPFDETFIKWKNPENDDIKFYKERLIRLI